jgi:hypothetical protein
MKSDDTKTETSFCMFESSDDAHSEERVASAVGNPAQPSTLLPFVEFDTQQNAGGLSEFA